MGVVEPVLISFSQNGSANTYGASGLLFTESLIITSGSIFIPFLYSRKEKDWLISFLKWTSPTLEMNKYINKILFRVFRETKNINENDQIENKTLDEAECNVVGVWKCPLIARSMENLFYDWTMGLIPDKMTSNSQYVDDIYMSNELVSTFILLKFKGKETGNEPKDNISALSNLLITLAEPNRGDEIKVISTPFGNKVFVNSFSRGIVSNVIGTEKTFFLADARTVMGCEGGPIFSLKKSRKNDKPTNKLIGLVVCSLTWWKSEWVGLTIGISLSPVLKRLLQSKMDYTILTEVSINKSNNSESESLSLDIVDQTVVFIRTDQVWGSGVVLDATTGTIITCSHVINNDETVSVYYKNEYYPASVVFKSRNVVAYDLAVIRTRQSSIFENEIEFSKTSPRNGDIVIAAGFPFFSELDDRNLRPSIVRGSIAQISPHMLQTTCCIQSGFSGGPLLLDGKLIGIIICNTRDGAGDLFPHINFAVPTSVFADSISKYLKTNDIHWLRILENSDPKVQSIWNFQLSKL